jgi:coenzyme F420-dependent glucose-6-phosphate dehydrogenase
VPRIDVARTACHWWAALALSADPDECVERIGAYVDQGFTHLVFHAPGPRRHRFLEDFAADVLPRLRERYGIAAQAA